MRDTSHVSRRLALLAAYIACCVALSASRAAAQSTLGLVPDPIIAAQLEIYASRLHLSPQQQVAVAEMHLKYAADYRTLREGDIEKFMTEREKLSLPDSVRRRRDLWERVGSLDHQFFDQVGTILSQQQAAILPAVRAVRERECLVRNTQVFLARRPCDLSVLLQQAKLDDAEQAAVADRLAQYEIAMASLLRELVRDSDLLMARQIKARLDAGLPESGPMSSAQSETEYAVGREFDAERNKQYRDALSRTRAVNREACRDLCSLLPPSSSHTLRNAFFGSDYNPNLKKDFGDSVFDQIVAGRELDATQQAALGSAIEEYNRALDAAIATMADGFDAYYGRYSPMESAGNSAAREDFRKVLTESTAALMEVRTNALKAVEAMLGEVPQQASAPIDPTAGEIDMGFRNIAKFTGTSINDFDLFLPGPMSAADIAALGEALKLEASAVEAIRQRYLDRCTQTDAGELATLREASKRVIQSRSVGAPPMSDEESKGIVNANLASRRTCLQAIVAADDAVFIEFRDAAGVKDDDPRLQRARDARARARCNRAIYGGTFDRYGPGARNDSMIDVSYLLRRRQPAIVAAPVIDAALIEYERALTPLMVSRYDLLLETNDLGERDLSVSLRRLAEMYGSNRGIAIGTRLRQIAPEQCKSIQSLNDQIAELNRQVVKSLVAAMPADAASRLQRDVDRLSYPRIFDDPSCAAPTLARALELKDMPQEQRAQLEQLAADYHAAYNDFCGRMMAAVETADSLRYNMELGDTEDGPRLQRELKQRESVRLRLAFDRNELNVRTFNRLKALLSEDQIKAMGGLPAIPNHLAYDYGV